MRTLPCLVLFVVCGLCSACGGSEKTNPQPDTDAAVPIDAQIDGPQLPGETCGGLLSKQCPANQYCDYPDNTCGIADEAGTCKARPDACPAVVGHPVCACDGHAHPSDCSAFSAGFDLNANGSCDLAADSFACGYAICTLQTQYCRHEIKPPAPDLYTCLPLPPACTRATPSCACLSAEQCGSSCSGDARVGLTLTCQ